MSDQPTKVETIDQYIDGFPEEVQKIMQQVRRTILEAAPQATEAISWGMATFKVKKNLVHFAGHKSHLGLYPGVETIEAFKNELSDYKTSKGGIQFPYNKPIPLDLISEMVRFGVQTLIRNR